MFVLSFFFNQKTAYELRISDCSSDVCSSDLQFVAVAPAARQRGPVLQVHARIAAVQRLDRGHRVQVDDVAAVDPHEAVRIELRGDRSEERRGGNEGVRTSRSRWSP